MFQEEEGGGRVVERVCGMEEEVLEKVVHDIIHV